MTNELTTRPHGLPALPPARSDRSRRPSIRALRRGAAVATVGLTVGVLTSLGQTHLNGTLNPLVNSASAWLVAPFVLGTLIGTRRGAAAAGLVCCLLQLVGYDATAHLRGFATGNSLLAFWGVCAVIGGPVFGAAGHVARHGRPGLRGLGPALLAAAFIAEGVWTYLHELHHYASAALWIAIGLTIAIARLHSRQRARWLALTIPLGLIGEIVLTQIYQ